VPLLTAPTWLFAVVTNNQVALVWNGVFGANRYNLQRSGISGGPYTTIASSLSRTNYADAAVTNGVTYYYVVSAVNTAGQNVSSAEASVTVPRNLPVRLGMSYSANGVLDLSFEGISNQVYILESTTNLSPPNWAPILTNSFTNGLFNYLISNPVDPQRFYRIEQ